MSFDAEKFFDRILSREGVYYVSIRRCRLCRNQVMYTQLRQHWLDCAAQKLMS